MNIQRAQQIIEAADTIQVTLNGQSVWIDRVDSTSSMAIVHDENNPAESRKVSVAQLQEA